uniref:Uncharacterized protein n=1 Tax=Anguilla anguilla TaxID=7936 RepID=A0A0E9XG01_ANGAN
MLKAFWLLVRSPMSLNAGMRCLKRNDNKPGNAVQLRSTAYFSQNYETMKQFRLQHFYAQQLLSSVSMTTEIFTFTQTHRPPIHTHTLQQQSFWLNLKKQLYLFRFVDLPYTNFTILKLKSMSQKLNIMIKHTFK